MRKKLLLSSKKKKKRIIKRIEKNTLKGKLIGIIFLLLALVVLFLPQIFLTFKPVSNSPIKINPSLLASKATQNDPVRILIPKVNIDLKVINARIINGYWEVSENTASYGLGSGQLGTKSNTVIFAHAREGLFYNLKNVKQDDIVYVFTKNNWYRYRVNKITSVYPSQTEVINPTRNEVLTLYTCTGFYDEKRLIITAIPQS